MERLSSGFRINRAADDAAGLGVSQKLKAQMGGLNQAVRNANDGISMIQTAEGGLDEIQNMMQRIRDLSVQAASDTNGSDERSNINIEMQQLKDEIDKTAQRTTFNGLGLLNGALVTSQSTSSTAFSGLVAGTGGVSDINVGQAKAGTTHTFSYNSTTDVLTLTAGSTSATVSLSQVAAQGSTTLNFAALGVSLVVKNGDASSPLAADTIGAALDAKTVITASGTSSASLQTGAYASNNDVTSIGFVNALVGTGATSGGYMKALGDALATFNSSTSQANASALISATDDALNYVSQQRATLGAAQNRLEHTVANLSTTSENIAASNSRIMDVDVATESSAMAKNQILQQAGVSVLAQANQSAQLALKLLS